MCDWHPRGVLPRSKGAGLFRLHRALATPPPPTRSWRKSVGTCQLSPAEAAPIHQRQPQGSRQLRGGCPSQFRGMGWGGWSAAASASWGPPQVRAWLSAWQPLTLVSYQDPGPTGHPEHCWESPGRSWDWRQSCGSPHPMRLWPSPEAGTGRSAWPGAGSRGTAGEPPQPGRPRVRPSGYAAHSPFTPTFSSPSFPPCNCMKCGLCTPDGRGGDRVC